MKSIAVGFALLLAACAYDSPEDVAASYAAISAHASTPRAAIVVTRRDDRAADELALDAPYSGRATLRDRTYAADFDGGRVEVFGPDGERLPITFADPTLPAGYAPFNVAALGGRIYVAYATSAPEGGGLVDAFDADGRLLARVAQGGSLDAPHALALAPASWGRLAGALLVGNHGDGAVHVFDPRDGSELGLVADRDGPLAIAELWSFEEEDGALRFRGASTAGTLAVE